MEGMARHGMAWRGMAFDERNSCVASCALLTHRYVLLRGRKRFRLYPPQLASKMYTVGKVAMVHPNGRIVFKGQVRPGCRTWPNLCGGMLPGDWPALVDVQLDAFICLFHGSTASVRHTTAIQLSKVARSLLRATTPTHQGDVLPDGSDAQEVKQYLARHDAERELAAAEAAVAADLPVRKLECRPRAAVSVVLCAYAIRQTCLRPPSVLRRVPPSVSGLRRRSWTKCWRRPWGTISMPWMILIPWRRRCLRRARQVSTGCAALGKPVWHRLFIRQCCTIVLRTVHWS